MWHLRNMAVLLGLGLLSACSTVSPPPGQTPYFYGDGSDGKALQAIIRKEIQLVPKCASKNTCDHVFFTRALASLYESRESASQYFEKVIAVAPKSQLAASSRLWLQLLQSEGMLRLLHIHRGFWPRQLSGPYTTCLIANSQFSNYGRCRIVRLSRSRRCNGNFKTRSGRRNCSIPEENTRGCRSSRLRSKACNDKSVIEIEKLRSSRVS